jgi:glycosyltransferase involved in cell wall biosynthesis
MKLKKITHLGKFYFPDSGGIESVTRTLAEGAANVGYDVNVICFTNSQHGSFEEKIGDVKVVRAGSFISIMSQPLSLTYLWKAFQFSRDSNIVHVHMPNMLAAFACIFIDPSKLLIHWHSDVLGKGFLGFFFKKLENYCIKRAQKIIVTSEIYANSSDDLKNYLEKVIVIPLGCKDYGAHYIKDTTSSLSEELNQFLKDKKLVLSVGRLVAYKGFDILIESVKYLDSDIVVVIVGSGPLRKELQGRICSLNLSHRIKLVGRQGEQELQELYKRAKIFCLPSIERSEAFGLVLLEAMSFGLPIVATKIPGSGVPWVNQQGVTGLNVEIKNPRSIAIACNQIINSHQTHNAYAKGSRLRYLKEFTEEIELQRALSLYNLML